MSGKISPYKSVQGQTQYFDAYEAAMRLWPVPYESFDVTTPYGQTHVISCGAKDAFPLVLLHGGYASSTMWFPNIADLAEKFHVLAFDTIGEPGRSVPTKQNATKGDLAAWLVGVLDEIRISQTCCRFVSWRLVGIESGYSCTTPAGENSITQPGSLFYHAKSFLFSNCTICYAHSYKIRCEVCTLFVGYTWFCIKRHICRTIHAWTSKLELGNGAQRLFRCYALCFP